MIPNQRGSGILEDFSHIYIGFVRKFNAQLYCRFDSVNGRVAAFGSRVQGSNPSEDEYIIEFKSII